MSYCFHSSACLRFLDGEEGSQRVGQILRSRSFNHAKLLISAIQWGEIAAVTIRRGAAREVHEALAPLTNLGFEAGPVTPEQAVRAAGIQSEYRIPYADAFLLALTQEHRGTTLVTADFDFKAVEQLVLIEFLPPKIAVQSRS